MSEKYDKIIIGAGFYGLYSALFCGEKGQRVLCWNATLRPLAVPPTSTRRAYTRDTITPGPFPQP